MTGFDFISFLFLFCLKLFVFGYGIGFISRLVRRF